MADCSDCNNSSGQCRGEYGSFAVEKQQRTHSGDASCEPDSTWDLRHSVNPQNASTETYDEVKGSYKHIYLNSYFKETPEDHIDQSCEDAIGSYKARPSNVEYYVRHPSSQTSNEYQFADPRPNDSGDYENFIVSTLLDIAAGVSGNVLVSAGAAVIKNYLGSMSSSSVDIGPYNPDPDRQKVWWDLDYSNEGFPQEPCDTTGVRFDIEPGINSGDRPVNTYSRYTIGNREYVDGYECVCDYSNITGVTYTTDWLLNQVTFSFEG